MIPSPALQASAQLAPTLSPRLQRAVRLLQMSSLEFSQLVRQAADTNPFLEVDREAATTADSQGQDAQDVQVGEDDPGGADAEGGEGEMTWGKDTTVRAPRASRTWAISGLFAGRHFSR